MANEWYLESLKKIQLFYLQIYCIVYRFDFTKPFNNMKYFWLGIQNYANVIGRASRKEYWMFVLFNILFGFLFGFLFGVIYGLVYGHMDNIWLPIIWQLFILIPSICIGVRRMHDVGKSGWYLLVPIYNFILAITAGDEGDNQYGAPSDN